MYAFDLGVKHLFIGNRDWGSYFENYVYLRLRARQPVSSVLSGRNELDFLTGDRTLIEAKYNTSIEGAQKLAFAEFQAPRKVLIQSVRDLPTLERLWER